MLLNNWMGHLIYRGGRTGFGIDCSGLSQLIYRFIGINIPRDADLQCQQGLDLFFGQQEQGDLLF